MLAVGFAAAVDLPATQQAQYREPPVFPASMPPVIPAAQPAADLGEAFVAVAEAVRPAVVFIQAESRSTRRRGSALDDFFRDPPNSDSRPRQGQGSGFIISTNGYIVTNNHVVEEATRLTVRLLDGRSYPAEVVGRDPNTDIAVIKIEAQDLPAARIGTSESVRIGEWVLAIGNPLGEAFSFTVTAGIVSGRGRRLQGLQAGPGPNYTIHDFIQTDAAINPGNSGGPLVNIHGEVIGVNSAIASQTGFYSGYGFAVPIDLAKRVSEQLISQGYVTRAVLGISIGNATAEDAEYVGLDSIYGVRIENFPDDASPARRAGLEEGDIIIAVDGKPARYTAQLQQEIGFRRPGEEVAVTVARRGGVRETYRVRLQAAPAEDLGIVQNTSAEVPAEDEHSRSKVGITVEEVTRSELETEGLNTELAGLRIVAVDPYGPSRDRLRNGQVITHVNAARILTRGDFEDALQQVTPGEVFSLRLAGLGSEGDVVRSTVRIRAGGQ
jgi:serine protease Do